MTYMPQVGRFAPGLAFGGRKYNSTPTPAPIIQLVAGSGSTTVTYGLPASASGLNNPFGVYADSSGNVYIADSYNQTIDLVTATTGYISKFAGTAGTTGGFGGTQTLSSSTFYYPWSVRGDSLGNIYVADTGNNAIRKISGNNVTVYAGSGGTFNINVSPAIYAGIAEPDSLGINPSNNNIIVGSYYEQNVRLITYGSTYGASVSAFAGTYNSPGNTGNGGSATSAKLNYPSGVCWDSLGNAYISDSGNNQIRKVDTSGIISVYAGTGTIGWTGDSGAATSATLSNPAGICCDSNNNLYIADTNNNVIRKITYSTGIITTIAGLGPTNAGNTGNGGPSTSAKLNLPSDIYVDANGRIYIADTGNNQIRKIS
jgi:trimeric autotransporter adhesin